MPHCCPDQQRGAATENVIQDEGRARLRKWDRHAPGLAAIHLSTEQPVRLLAALEQ